MTPNDELVEGIRKGINALVKWAASAGVPANIVMAHPDYAMRLEETANVVLAACDAEFDRMFDEIHPESEIKTCKWIGDGWAAWVYWPTNMMDTVRGTGETRMAAIRDAVAQAKGEQG